MAYTKGTVTPTEMGGQYKIVTVKVTPDAATGDVTLTEISNATAILGFGFTGDLTVNCYSMQAAIDGSTANKINFKLWKAGGTAADTAYVAFWVAVLGY
jgi:hypothetical protein